MPSENTEWQKFSQAGKELDKKGKAVLDELNKHQEILKKKLDEGHREPVLVLRARHLYRMCKIIIHYCELKILAVKAFPIDPFSASDPRVLQAYDYLKQGEAELNRCEEELREYCQLYPRD
jgi:hypothetical protein